MCINAIKKVFKNPGFLFLALLIAMIIFLGVVWFSNFGLIREVIFDSSIPVGNKIALLTQLGASIRTNFTPSSALYILLIAVLFGVYLTMLIYFLKRRVKEVKQSGVITGFLGILNGALGVGCAACGSFLVTSLSLIGAGSVLAFLPFGGSEFAILGIGMILLAIYKVAKKIQNPSTCKI